MDILGMSEHSSIIVLVIGIVFVATVIPWIYKKLFLRNK